MSSPAAKAIPLAKVMKFIKSHLELHPEEGAAIMVAIQSGEFKAKAGANREFFPDYKKLAKISSDDKVNYLVEWLPSTSIRMWAKASKANADIAHQVFYAMISESSECPLVTRSKQIFQEMIAAKRAAMKSKPTIAFGDNFAIDWAKHGVYELTSPVEKNGEQVFTMLLHRPSGHSVPLQLFKPPTTTHLNSVVLSCSSALRLRVWFGRSNCFGMGCRKVPNSLVTWRNQAWRSNASTCVA